MTDSTPVEPQEVPARVVRWAAQPGPTKVLAAVRRRLEAGHGMERGRLGAELTASEREEIGQLLGVRWMVGGQAVGARALVDALRGAGTDVETLLTLLGGPLRDRPAERAAAKATAETERQAAYETLTNAGVPGTAATSWLGRRGLPPAGTGQLSELADQVAAVWARLPGEDDEPVLLQVLAASALPASVVDRTHRLDRGRSLAVAVLRLARGGGEDWDAPVDAEGWRAAWEELGVACDPLSSRVLALNLPLVGDAVACRLAAAAMDAGEPLWLTWRSLDGGGVVPPGREVFVCENPSVVVVAADRLGARCPPLVCTDGHPSAAARRLIRMIAAGAAVISIRADDDAAGQQIVAGLLALAPDARLWRYTQRTEADAAANPRFEEDDIDSLISDLADVADRALRPGLA